MGDYPPIGRVTEADMQAEVWRVATKGRACPMESDFDAGRLVYQNLCDDRCNSVPDSREQSAMVSRIGRYCWRWYFEQLAIRNGAQTYPGTEVPK